MVRQRRTRPEALQTDALIVGGGIAGLWIQRRLLGAGIATVLVEQDSLGGSQTAATQGIIHGGVKYALGGRLTGSRETIAGMPARWRRCIDGKGEVDLRGVDVLADACHLWTLGSPASALASLLEHQALRGHVLPLLRQDHPPCFRQPGFHGTVYRLDELVLDPASLIRTLATPVRGLTLAMKASGQQLKRLGDGFVLQSPAGPLHARHLILAAGDGNPVLLESLGLEVPAVQRQPLQQVCVTARHGEPIYGHCVTSLNEDQPELTLTSHPAGAGQWLLYLGGRLAEEGAKRTPERQISVARELIANVLPWLAPHLDGWRTRRVYRVQAVADTATLPERAFLHEQAGVLTVWPDKMSLVPALGDHILERLSDELSGDGDAATGRIEALTAALVDCPRPGLTRGLLDWVA